MRFIFAIVLVLLIGCSQVPKVPDSFAQCVTQSGAVMYGTEWCSHCQNQKKAFGDSFKFIDFVDCNKHAQVCDEAGVRGFPTWNIKGENYPGKQSLYKLASLTGCELE